MTEELYIKELAATFELPAEQVALVWSTTKFLLADHCDHLSLEDMYEYVDYLLVGLFPK